MKRLIEEYRVPVLLAGIVLTMLALMATFYQTLRRDDSSLAELTTQIATSDANFDKAVVLLDKAANVVAQQRRLINAMAKGTLWAGVLILILAGGIFGVWRENRGDKKANRNSN